MPATSSLRDCQALVAAVQEAGGSIPKPLASILSGAALLNAHSATADPARAIVDSAAAGQLTAAKLTTLLTRAATAAMINSYRGELRQRSERLFTQAFHDALHGGCADELIEAMRPVWDEHAEAIAAARAVINAESSADQILASAQPAVVTAWQGLHKHIAVIDTIGRIAAQFGPRTGNFPQITEYSLADGHLIEDCAVMATDGPIPLDSSAFRRPDQGHRTSPWFKLPLKLHSVASAQARYDEWASGEWERLHAGPVTSWIDDKGQMHEMPRPENPFKAKESVT